MNLMGKACATDAVVVDLGQTAHHSEPIVITAICNVGHAHTFGDAVA
jgi:hypothetical protein